MSEIEQASVEKTETIDKKESFFGNLVAFVKKHIHTIIFCIIFFLLGYFMSQYKGSCPVVLNDDFNSGDSAD